MTLSFAMPWLISWLNSIVLLLKSFLYVFPICYPNLCTDLLVVQNVKSYIAYSTNTWMTLYMMFVFTSTIANWVDEDWKLIKYVIDFHSLREDEHKGIKAEHALLKSIQKQGSANKISVLSSLHLGRLIS